MVAAFDSAINQALKGRGYAVTFYAFQDAGLCRCAVASYGPWSMGGATTFAALSGGHRSAIDALSEAIALQLARLDQLTPMPPPIVSRDSGANGSASMSQGERYQREPTCFIMAGLEGYQQRSLL